VRVIHNASIMNAVASCGLQLYNFGQTITIPFWDDKWEPDSFYEKILHNAQGGLHTLCLLGESVPVRLVSRRLTHDAQTSRSRSRTLRRWLVGRKSSSLRAS
jgi:diphthamide biosynthesis methyltransferase